MHIVDRVSLLVICFHKLHASAWLLCHVWEKVTLSYRSVNDLATLVIGQGDRFLTVTWLEDRHSSHLSIVYSEVCLKERM